MDHFKLFFSKIAVLHCRGCTGSSSATALNRFLRNFFSTGRHASRHHFSARSFFAALGRSKAVYSKPASTGCLLSKTSATLLKSAWRRRAMRPWKLSPIESPTAPTTRKRISDFGASLSLRQGSVESFCRKRIGGGNLQQSSPLPAL